MKKLQLALVLLVISSAGLAQKRTSLRGQEALSYIQNEMRPLQTTAYQYPIEKIAVDVYYKTTTYVLATGWLTAYGDSVYIDSQYSPQVRMFSDSINPGDTEILPDPIAGREIFGIRYHSALNLMIERRPWSSMKAPRFDTTHVFTGNLGINPNHTQFRFGIRCALLAAHAQSVRIIDTHLGTTRVLSITEVLNYDFAINMTDSANTRSRRSDRFLILVERPGFTIPTSIGPKHSLNESTFDFKLYPVPVGVGGTLTVTCGVWCEKTPLIITDMLGRTCVRQTFTGKTVRIQLPSSMRPGTYTLIIGTGDKSRSKVFQIQ